MKYLIKFQKENNLVTDGLIGKMTISKMKEIFVINSSPDIAHFLGQLSHETSNFKYGKENLNYSAKRLIQIFPKYFKNGVWGYDRNPEAIANKVYANRMGNGNEDSGDGWKYRGRGSIQLTGRENYESFSSFVNDLQVIKNPDIVESKYYWNVAIWYFNKRNIWSHTDKVTISNIKKVTRLINGGYNGLQHRINLTKHFYYLSKK